MSYLDRCIVCGLENDRAKPHCSRHPDLTSDLRLQITYAIRMRQQIKMEEMIRCKEPDEVMLRPWMGWDDRPGMFGGLQYNRQRAKFIFDKWFDHILSKKCPYILTETSGHRNLYLVRLFRGLEWQ